jgi:hypothetical protein
LKCADIVNDTQCKEETEIEGEGGCAWIYKNNDTSLTDGTCVTKNIKGYFCTGLNRTNQCSDGASITELFKTCALYPADPESGTCKELCSKIEDISICSGTGEDNRKEDCYWLKENGTVSKERCVNKV